MTQRVFATYRIALLAVVLMLLPGIVAALAQLRLGEHGFDWTTVEQDRAHFRWSAEVVNGTNQEFAVKVTVDLLDDDDTVVHSDSTTTQIAADSQVRVEHDGSLSFDRAADVVSFRFRLDPSPPGRR